MYNIGELVVYGSWGVCKVVDICVPDMPGATKQCYRLQPQNELDTKIYAPVGQNNIAMRKPLTGEETSALLESMPTMKVIKEENKFEAQKAYKGALQSADCAQLAVLIKTLYGKKAKLRKEKKMFGGQDKDMLYSAERLLYGELSMTLQMHKEQVASYVSQQLALA